MATNVDPHEDMADMADMACFVISVAAKLLNVHPQTLRYYERAGLIEPSRSRGNMRLYSARDIERAIAQDVDPTSYRLTTKDTFTALITRHTCNLWQTSAALQESCSVSPGNRT